MDLTSLGLPVEGGPEFGVARESSVERSFGEKTPFVLAFRMRKIIVSSSGQVDNKPVTGGLLGRDDEERKSKEAQQAKFDVEWVDAMDTDADEFEIDDSREIQDTIGASTEAGGCSLAFEL